MGIGLFHLLSLAIPIAVTLIGSPIVSKSTNRQPFDCRTVICFTAEIDIWAMIRVRTC